MKHGTPPIAALIGALLAFAAPFTAPAAELFTNVYVVPATFPLWDGGEGEKKPAGEDAAERSAKEILKSFGIAFPEGASAIYNRQTSQLIVRNTEGQMRLVETVIDSLRPKSDQPVDPNLRVDVPADRRLAEKEPKAAAGEQQIRFTLREVTLPRGKESEMVDRDAAGIAGVFTDPQFQLLMRQLEDRADLEILSTPEVVVSSGQPALIEVGERRWGLTGQMGPDGYTIDVGCHFLKPGEPWGAEESGKRVAEAKVAIWEGQTICYATPLNEKQVRVTFVSAAAIKPETGAPAAPAHADFLLKSDERLIIVEVKKGDSLFSIAQEHGTSVGRIKSVNRLGADLVRVGHRLLIPVAIDQKGPEVAASKGTSL
jgi:hypothetical protein